MRIVIGLGARAYAPRGAPATAAAQRAGVEHAAEALAPLIREHQVVIAHGGGPAAGDAGPSAGAAAPLGDRAIASLLEQALRHEVATLDVATLVTSCVVDSRDPAFASPTLPVGPVLDEATAARLVRERGFVVAPGGGGYRRVVPSPEPQAILERVALLALIDAAVTVVATSAGGGPVVLDDLGRPSPSEGVVDQDEFAVTLAEAVGADALVLLTDVDAVYRDFGTDHATPLRRVTPHEAGALVTSGEIAPDTMGSKLEAARRFAETGGYAVIAAVDDAVDAMRRTAGTRIVVPAPDATARERARV